MSTIHNSPFIGTELKLNIHIESIGSITMDDYKFEVETYCIPAKTIVTNKNDMIRVDSNNYIVLVDTNEIGVGKLRCKVTAYIPDADFNDGFRTEVVNIDTGIEILRSI